MKTETSTTGVLIGTAISLVILFGFVWVAGKAWKSATK